MRNEGAMGMSEQQQRDKKQRSQKKVAIDEHPARQLRRMIDQLIGIEQQLSTPQGGKKSSLTLRYRVALELAALGPLTVLELADRLGAAHPGVTQATRQLESTGDVLSMRDRLDRRRRVIALTRQGQHRYGVDVAFRESQLLAPSIRSDILACADSVDRLAEAFETNRASSDGWLGSLEWVELSASHIDDMAMMLEADDYDASEMQTVWQRMKKTTPQDQQWSMGLRVPRFKPPVSWLIAERQSNGSLDIVGLFTHKRFRRSGLATRLLEALQEYGQNTGSKGLSTHVAEHFDSARLFFERHLFERVAPSKDSRDRLRMVRDLKI
jgi:DNA-binding MarR family transcriptional regulator/GNAT superfamily N-acetyltransferase